MEDPIVEMWKANDVQVVRVEKGVVDIDASDVESSNSLDDSMVDNMESLVD